MIAVNNIDGLTDKNSSDAPYSLILSKIRQQLSASYSIELLYFPAIRARVQFEQGRVDCLFPSSKVGHKTRFELMDSEPVNIAEAYLMSHSKISTQTLLDKTQGGLIIAYRRGYDFGGKTDALAHHYIIKTNSDEQALQLAQKGRADVMIGYITDFQFIPQSAYAKPLAYDNDTLFHTQNDSFLCQQNERLSTFIKALNAVITDLHESGQMADVLGDLYLYEQHKHPNVSK